MKFTSCAKKDIHCCDIENAGGVLKDAAGILSFANKMEAIHKQTTFIM